MLLDWVREMSAGQPVLFVVEDLHWGDPSTLEFLELMVHEGQHGSIMIPPGTPDTMVEPCTSDISRTESTDDVTGR